jgi:hypothetical protein
MTSPLCQARAIFPEEGAVLVQDLLCALVLILGLALAQAAGVMTITMWPKMTAGQIRSTSVGTPTPLRVMTADVTIALTIAIPFLPPSLPQVQREVSAIRNRESRQ